MKFFVFVVLSVLVLGLSFHWGWKFGAVETETRLTREQTALVKRLRKAGFPERHEPFTGEYRWIAACTNCAAWTVESIKITCDPSNHEIRRKR